MKTKFYAVLTIVLLLFYGCSSKDKRESNPNLSSTEEASKGESAASDRELDKSDMLANEEMKADSTASIVSMDAAANEPAGIITQTPVAPMSPIDSTLLTFKLGKKKIIKTAELRFKVKKVETATAKIEEITRHFGGYVVGSDLRSTPYKTTTQELSSDSLLIVTEYEVSNQMTIRVPFYYYDSVLTQLAKLHLYLDYRILKTEDVTSSFLRNKLKAESKTKYEKRINTAVDEKNRRLDDVVNAETQAAALADQAIENKIANFEIQDRIDYSSITMNLYQAHEIYKEKTVNIRLSDYKPDFGQRAWNALVFGWDLLKYIVLALIYLWSVMLIAALIFVVIRFFVKRAAKKKRL